MEKNKDNIKIDVFKYLENDLLNDKKNCIKNMQQIVDIFEGEIPTVYYKYKGQLEYIEILLSKLKRMDYSEKE